MRTLKVCLVEANKNNYMVKLSKLKKCYEVFRFLKIRSSILWLIMTFLTFYVKCIMVGKWEEFFLFDLVSKIWVVRFIEIKFNLRVKLSVRLTQVSALECQLYGGNFIRILPENGQAKFVSALARCPLKSISALDRFHCILIP